MFCLEYIRRRKSGIELDEYGAITNAKKGRKNKSTNTIKTSKLSIQIFILKICGALSTSHSTERALPAISLNSAPGSLDLIRVANIIMAKQTKE